MRNLRYLWMFPVVFMLAACGKNRPQEGAWEPGTWPARLVSVDGFGPDERPAILAAVESMNRGAGRTLIQTTSGTGGYPITIMKVEVDPDRQTRAGLAIVDQDQCVIQISRMVFTSEHREKLIPVVEHELGHCAGLSHDPAQGEVMYKASESMSTYRPDAFSRFFTRVRQSVGL